MDTFQNVFIRWKKGNITLEKHVRVYSCGDRCMDFAGTYVGGNTGETYTHLMNGEPVTLPLFSVPNQER